MRRVAVLMALVLLAALFGQNRPVAAQTNLLRNPGFEAPYSAWGGIGPIQVAHEWTPWWTEQPDHNPAWFRPEWKPAEGSIFPNRVLGGERAQQWFTFHASHYAGMYQQVFNVQPGVRYQFSIYAQVWSSTEDNPDVSVLPANPHLQIGIDPTGNWNPFSGDIVWSGEASMSSVIDQWGYVVVEATAANNVITVFMKTSPAFSNKHNDTYWDNASLIVAGQAPPPTNTPAPPTAVPSETPIPPPTAVPSETPISPPTAVPTETPIPPPPTETPVPPTATTVPTDTPVPTETTVPTETAAPTETARANCRANGNC